MFIKRTKKILVSQHVQSSNSAKKGIDKDLSAGDDVFNYNISGADNIPRLSGDGSSVSDCEEFGVDTNTGENQSLAERRERRHVSLPARYADGAAMVVVRVKEPRSV